MSKTVLRACTSELAWLARDAGQRLPTRADYQTCDRAANPNLAYLTMAYVHGQRLKADFRFRALADASPEWLSRYPDDGMVRSLAAFGALGARQEGAEAFLARALSADDGDKHCRLVCLQALWLATDLPDQPERMIALSNELIGRGEDDANLYYWRASALRRLGRLDDAVASIDTAIHRLPVGMNAVHQDYVRERELIATTRFVSAHVEREAAAISDRLRTEVKAYLEEVQAEIDRQSSDARQIVSGSLLNLVEVLGIFVAITGFLVASGTVVLRSASFWQSFAGVVLLLCGAVAFFLLLRFIVRFQRRR